MCYLMQISCITGNFPEFVYYISLEKYNYRDFAIRNTDIYDLEDKGFT